MRIKIAITALAAAAMCIAAFGPTGASATQLEQCGGTGTATAVSCGSGVFWTKVPANTKLTITGVGATTLAATIAGVEVDIDCHLHGEGQASNSGSGATSQIKGRLKLTFEECVVTKPAGGVCTLETPIVSAELEWETILETMKDKFRPFGGGPIMTLSIGGASCPAALKGSKTLTGSITAEGNEATGEESFTVTSGSEAKLGGQAATFLATVKYDTLGTNTQVFSRTP